jgi:hypothetical protein
MGRSIDKEKNEYIHHCRTEHEYLLYMQKRNHHFCPTGAKQIRTKEEKMERERMLAYCTGHKNEMSKSI